MSDLAKHEWFTPVPGGPHFCGVCGSKSEGSPPWCRGRPVEGKRPDSAPSPQLVSLADAFRNIEPRSAEEMAEYRWENETSPRLKAGGFEQRHRQKIVNWNCAPQQRVFERCLEILNGSGAIIVLTGARGTGKTTICGQLARLRAEDESLPPWDRQPPYRKLVDLIARYKPLYGNMGTVDMDDLSVARDWYCRNPSLAFVDEIHECEDAALKNRVLTDIIDRRYAAKKDTILISNQSIDDFNAATSDSIRSRISEHGEIIPCNWKSWRAKGY